MIYYVILITLTVVVFLAVVSTDAEGQGFCSTSVRWACCDSNDHTQCWHATMPPGSHDENVDCDESPSACQSCCASFTDPYYTENAWNCKPPGRRKMLDNEVTLPWMSSLVFESGTEARCCGDDGDGTYVTFKRYTGSTTSFAWTFSAEACCNGWDHCVDENDNCVNISVGSQLATMLFAICLSELCIYSNSYSEFSIIDKQF